MATITIEGERYQVDAVLFDKDGTLLDLNRLWTGWLTAVLNALSADLAPAVKFDPGTAHAALGVSTGSEPRIDPRGPLAIGAMGDVMSILAQVLYQQHQVAWNDAVQFVSRARATAEAALDWDPLIQPMPGVQAFVAAVQAAGVPMGVVTSDDHDSAVQHLKALGLEEAMTVVIGHDDVERGKPFPDMVQVACKALGITPERAMLFGDSNGDMQMARAAAMVAGIGLAPEGAGAHLSDATQVIADYTVCSAAATG